MKLMELVHDRHVAGRRVRVLSAHLAEAIPDGARVLDVGCGDGQIAALVKQQRPDIEIEGTEVLVRPGTEIPVTEFDGQRLPFADGSFDVVILVDVLHHTEDPMTLLREAQRVTRHSIIIKDHLKEGLLANATLRFMDRVGNCRYGVALPHNYWTRRQWRKAHGDLGVDVEQWNERLGLYTWPGSLLFDRSLHMITQWKVRLDAASEAGSSPESGQTPGGAS